jgi:hypothetical protein
MSRSCAFWKHAILVLCCFLLLDPSQAQEGNAPGHSLGKVSTTEDLIVLELQDGVLGKANLFDLAGRTLRFTPEGTGYRAENAPLAWDSDFGAQLTGPEITLHQFTFPFSGQQWKSFRVGATGSLKFGAAGADATDPYGNHDAGVIIDRFDQLAEAASRIIRQAPAICVFFKPRLFGPRYVKELLDRVVITWDLSEPFGSLLDFTWFKTVNRFQAVLYSDGSIAMSYKEVAAKDAIVGIYPALSGGEKLMATIKAPAHALLLPFLDVQKVKLSAVGATLMRVTFQTRGKVPQEGDPAMRDIAYRIDFSFAGSHGSPAASWIIHGMTNPYGPKDAPPKYFVYGEGVFPDAKISGNSIEIEGILPQFLRGAARVTISVQVVSGAHGELIQQMPPHIVRLAQIRDPEAHLSSITRKDGPFPIIYQSFHYPVLPRPRDLSCSVIQALGDKFDFLVYYSDFRIDSQEASSPSDGPAAGYVSGIGQMQHDLESYCSRGRFQWALAQPVYVGANEMQEGPPAAAPVASKRDITFYLHQLAEASADGKALPYNYAMSHLGHEMGHRWAAYISAKVDGKIIPLAVWPHWLPTLQARVAFPYQQPIEASTLGGGVWQDNLNGTFTRLRDGYFVPAPGYSYLDLYLMGFIAAAEVPDFFILNRLVPAGKDADGHAVFKAEPTKVTIQDVIAAEGPRVPDVDHSQRKFNTGFVLIVEHGQAPSRELVERASGVRQQWIEFWERTTGHRSSMMASPR